MRLGQEADTTWISLEMYCEIQKRMKMIEHMRLLYLISCCRYKYLIFNMFFIYTHTMSCVLQVRQRHLKNTVSCFYVYIVVTIWGTLCLKTYRTNPPCAEWEGSTVRVFNASCTHQSSHGHQAAGCRCCRFRHASTTFPIQMWFGYQHHTHDL